MPLRSILLATIAIALFGCVDVKPYERGRLAHPSMTTSDLAGQGEAHARGIQEGAVGGGTQIGGGCGCN